MYLIQLDIKPQNNGMLKLFNVNSNCEQILQVSRSASISEPHGRSNKQRTRKQRGVKNSVVHTIWPVFVADVDGSARRSAQAVEFFPIQSMVGLWVN